MATKTKVNIPDHYVVRVKKIDRTVDTVLALIFLALAAFASKFFFTGGNITDQPAAFTVRLVTIPLLLYLAFWHYPKYVLEKVEVDGENLTLTKLYFRKYHITFKDIDDIYFDGKKDSAETRNSNGSHAMILVWGNHKYRIPCDFCDDWPILKADLKKRGIAVRR